MFSDGSLNMTHIFDPGAEYISMKTKIKKYNVHLYKATAVYFGSRGTMHSKEEGTISGNGIANITVVDTAKPIKKE